MTLWRWLGKLEKARRIQSFSDMKKIKIDDENGRGHETTLYNLNVLNQLAMVCIDNEKLNDVPCKFSDILSEVETTGSYGVAQPEMSDEEIMSRALKIAHRTLALQEVIGHDRSPTNRRRLIKPNSSHRGRLLLTPCNAKRAEPCAQQAVRFVASRTAFFFSFALSSCISIVSTPEIPNLEHQPSGVWGNTS